MFEGFPKDVPYSVVINHEEQYSIWPTELDALSGWKNVGKSGSIKDCVAYLQQELKQGRPLPSSMQAEMAKKARTMLRKG